MKKKVVTAALASLLAGAAFAQDCVKEPRGKACGHYSPEHGFGKLTQDQKDQFPAHAVVPHATQPR